LRNGGGKARLGIWCASEFPNRALISEIARWRENTSDLKAIRLFEVRESLPVIATTIAATVTGAR
jgi:hypothetical protein